MRLWNENLAEGLALSRSELARLNDYTLFIWYHFIREEEQVQKISEIDPARYQ